MKEIIIIGVGRFGLSVAKELFKKGYEILAVDKDETRVQKVANYATYAVQADFTNEDIMERFEIDKFDIGIVGIGKSLYDNLVTTFVLNKFNVSHIVVKAKDKLQGELLKEIGADKVVYPERDIGIKMVEELNNRVLEY
ncbi:potassium channel family protein [Acetohalobium arabaticum]|uniref:TrkA-N domain protein n=1 Tax=Acetohalobium arabaticum (strain ATCC 49924 / DSM 5501 / Z-7288) TaxID=574087 RepID=D9QUE0_ACEAZ|nr:TrkA family potassium uptake protein [Acetohalobium arabaticum]ADL11933.1 TrkA-N domain protein [Acetohalobium arabaticum DSM 5501]